MKVGFIGYNVVGEHIKTIIEKKYSDIEYIYFDDILFKNSINNSYPFIKYKDFLNKEIYFIITLGYKHLPLRNNIINEIISHNGTLLTVIDQSVIMAEDVEIGKGVIICSGVILGNNVIIEDGALLHNGVVVSHDSRIGKSVYISPNSTICGNVEIQDCSFIGANTSIANNTTIGQECVIGIGSVITKNLKNQTHGIGNPFKVLKSKINLK